jgi:hypothetical protein
MANGIAFMNSIAFSKDAHIEHLNSMIREYESLINP